MRNSRIDLGLRSLGDGADELGVIRRRYFRSSNSLWPSYRSGFKDRYYLLRNSKSVGLNV